MNNEIRTIRNSLGLSQQELASRLGVSANTVSRWEIGRVTPSSMTMIAIRSIGGVDQPEALNNGNS